MNKDYYKYLSNVNELGKLGVIYLKDIVSNCHIPALARGAAVRLYELGERDYAIDFLIKQMNQYKLASTNKNIIRETCPEAAKELGRLKDDKAVEHLFSSLGELGFGPAYGLAKYNSSVIEHRLIKIAENESNEAVYAAVALGYMKNIQIIPRLIYLIYNHEEYEKKINDMWIFRLRYEILCILGSYTDIIMARNAFYKNLVENDIDWILCKYILQYDNPSVRWLEWEIATKHNWNNHINSEEIKFVFRHLNIDQWKLYSSHPCPFNSMSDTKILREQVVSDILRDTAMSKRADK